MDFVPAARARHKALANRTRKVRVAGAVHHIFGVSRMGSLEGRTARREGEMSIFDRIVSREQDWQRRSFFKGLIKTLLQSFQFALTCLDARVIFLTATLKNSYARVSCRSIDPMLVVQLLRTL